MSQPANRNGVTVTAPIDSSPFPFGLRVTECRAHLGTIADPDGPIGTTPSLILKAEAYRTEIETPAGRDLTTLPWTVSLQGPTDQRRGGSTSLIGTVSWEPVFQSSYADEPERFELDVVMDEASIRTLIDAAAHGMPPQQINVFVRGVDAESREAVSGIRWDIDEWPHIEVTAIHVATESVAVQRSADSA
jgi:hypothetical protein